MLSPPSPAPSILAIASTAVEEAVHANEAMGAAIELHDADGRPVVCIASASFERSALERYVEEGYLHDPCRAWIRESGEPLVTSERMSARAARELAASYGCRDALSRHTFIAPLFGDTEIIGHFRAAYEHALSEPRRRSLGSLASRISLRLAQLGFMRGARPSLEKLTPRQRHVARLVARGLTNAEIARELRVSLDAVKKHMKLALSSLGLANRAALAVAVTSAAASTDNLGEIADAPGLHVIRAPSERSR